MVGVVGSSPIVPTNNCLRKLLILIGLISYIGFESASVAACFLGKYENSMKKRGVEAAIFLLTQVRFFP